MVSKRCHALSDESVRAATVLASWARIPGLVPETDILEHIKGKKSHAKKTTVITVDTGDDVQAN